MPIIGNRFHYSESIRIFYLIMLLYESFDFTRINERFFKIIPSIVERVAIYLFLWQYNIIKDLYWELLILRHP